MDASLENLNENLKLYCVRSKPKKERMAAECLKQLHGLDVFAPQIRFKRKTVRGPVWFQEAMFPGYLFARFDLLEMKRQVCSAPGVLTMPMFNEKISPIPAVIIDDLRNQLNAEQTAEAHSPLVVGEETKILSGSMMGLKVKVIKLMPAQQRVAVLMEMLGTMVEVVFPEDALEHEKRHPLAKAM